MTKMIGFDQAFAPNSAGLDFFYMPPAPCKESGVSPAIFWNLAPNFAGTYKPLIAEFLQKLLNSEVAILVNLRIHSESITSSDLSSPLLVIFNRVPFRTAIGKIEIELCMKFQGEKESTQGPSSTSKF